VDRLDAAGSGGSLESDEQEEVSSIEAMGGMAATETATATSISAALAAETTTAASAEDASSSSSAAAAASDGEGSDGGGNGYGTTATLQEPAASAAESTRALLEDSASLKLGTGSGMLALATRKRNLAAEAAEKRSHSLVGTAAAVLAPEGATETTSSMARTLHNPTASVSSPLAPPPEPDVEPHLQETSDETHDEIDDGSESEEDGAGVKGEKGNRIAELERLLEANEGELRSVQVRIDRMDAAGAGAGAAAGGGGSLECGEQEEVSSLPHAPAPAMVEGASDAAAPPQSLPAMTEAPVDWAVVEDLE